MGMHLRQTTPGDAPECGRICYEAFATLADHHRFPHDFPSPAAATELVSGLIAHPRIFGVAAEVDGRIVGSNFLDERSTISSVGPITVLPEAQNRRVGRALMEAVLDRCATQRPAGVRLLQVAYHNRSLSLYTSLGFDVREPFAAVQGEPVRRQFAGYAVRPATEADVVDCNALCMRVHGHDRAGELADAVPESSAKVVERQGRITGYTTGIGMFAHSVAETNDDLIALIAAADEFSGPGFLVPLRNGELLRWCLRHRLRVVYMLNLMTIGLYQEPRGAFLASIGY